MNFTDIQARLTAIRALGISQLDQRQPLLVELLVDIVNHETSNGDDTCSDYGLNHQDYWMTLNALAKDAGFTMLGNGHFSAAYSHDMLPERIIKVGFKKEDSGAAYVAFCRMHQGKSGIPNIHAVARHAGCYTVVMDKLEPCDRNDEWHDECADIARNFVHGGCGYDAEDYGESVQGLIETCQSIYTFFKGIASFDMHSGNIMFGKDGTPYITDPVSFSHDREREEGFALDPEELLVEIEAALQDKLIERCRYRKAKCDPQGTFRQNRKASMKRRRASKRNFKKRQEADIQFGKELALNNKQRLRDAERAWVIMGETNWRHMWIINKRDIAAAADEAKAMQWKVADGLAIQAGGRLMIDKWMDAQFIG